MKLLYINKINTNAGWGMETFINQSFQELRVKTICVDYQENKYDLAKKLLTVQDEFDALLLERGGGYLIPLSVLKAIQRPRFFLFTELVARNPDQHYLIKSGLFDHIFFRSIPCMKWVRQQGWLQDNQMSLFLSAINPKFHRYLPEIEKDIDVLFVGTLLPRRQKIIDELSKHFSVKACTAFGEEMVHLFNRSKIILNLHGTDLPDTETRVYEALACKSFLITERLSEENPFQNFVHLVETDSLSAMLEKLHYYLENDEARAKIAYSGYLETLKNHTTLSRAKQIKTVLQRQPLQADHKTQIPSLNRPVLSRLTLLERGLELRETTWYKSRTVLSKVKRIVISH